MDWMTNFPMMPSMRGRERRGTTGGEEEDEVNGFVYWITSGSTMDGRDLSKK